MCITITLNYLEQIPIETGPFVCLGIWHKNSLAKVNALNPLHVHTLLTYTISHSYSIYLCQTLILISYTTDIVLFSEIQGVEYELYISQGGAW